MKVSFNLPESLHQEIDERAQEEKITPDELMQRAITDYLEEIRLKQVAQDKGGGI